MTGSGLLILIILFILGQFGILATDTQLVQYLSDIAVIAGWLFTIWGQLRRKDLSFGLFRR